MIGGSLFYDFAWVGATPAPFQSFVLSAGVVTDYVYGAGMHWQGGLHRCRRGDLLAERPPNRQHDQLPGERDRAGRAHWVGHGSSV